jgi:restriction system protein
MKFQMSSNSLFAILLRNPWWISFVIAAVISLLSAALLPKNLALFGAFGSLPFVVIGCIALKRQWNVPSRAAVEANMTRLSHLSWRDFSAELEAKFVQQGYEVRRLNKSDGAADFALNKMGQITLVAAKRYKAATHGIEPLQALVAQVQAQGADKAIYVCLGPLSEPAQKYALEHRVVVGPVL